MTIDSVVKGVDPIRGRDIPAADLDDLRRIMSVATTHPRRGPRTAIVRQYGRRPLLVGALVIALLALAAVPVSLGVLSSHRSTTPTTSPGHASSTIGSWSLAGYITTTGWQASSSTGPLPTTQQFTTQLSCPSVTTCYSSGTYVKNRYSNSQSVVSVTHDAGKDWRVSLAPADDTYFFGFSCQSDDVCAAIGEVPGSSTSPVLYSTVDGGLTWVSHPLPARNAASLEMSCATLSNCVVLGSEPVANTAPDSYGWITKNRGSSWTAVQLPAGFVPSNATNPAISCFAEGTCIADGTTSARPGAKNTAEMIYSVNSGLTWSTAATPSISSVVGSMSCSSDKDCVAVQMHNDVHGELVANGVLVTSDAGVTWSLLSAPTLDSTIANRPISIDSLTCPTATTCWASANVIESLCEGSCAYLPDQAVMLVTADGGSTWTSDPLPTPPSSSLQYVGDFPVTCANASDCLSVGILGLTEAASHAGVPSVEQDVVLSNTAPIDPSSNS
jgi:hypothetical protein